MIPPSAIQRYLDRKLDDHRWLKEQTHDEVDALLDGLPDPPKFWHGLMLHQKVCLYLGLTCGDFCHWLDMGCVDANTEFLSPDGWCRIAIWKGQQVAQYDPADETIAFVKAAFIKKPCNTMLRFKTTRGVDQLLSFGHRVLLANGEVISAAELRETYGNKNRFRYKFRTTFKIRDAGGIALTAPLLRLQVAVNADGSMLPRKKSVRVAIRLKRTRKIRRLRRLLAAAGIVYVERKCLPEGFRRFVFEPPEPKHCFEHWWCATQHQLEIIADELPHWDGSHRKKEAVSFFTTIGVAADFAQFAFSASGRRSSVHMVERKGHSEYTVFAKAGDPTVGIFGRSSDGDVRHNIWEEASPDGFMYCFNVPTGFLLLRRNGRIFATGNTGKTLVALELLQYWWERERIRRALVFVTSDKAFPTWEAQIKKYKIEVPYIALDAPSSEIKWDILNNFGDGIVLLHYPGTVRMVSGKVSVRGKNKLVIYEDKLQDLLHRVDALVLDESTKCSNHRSLTFDVAFAASQQAKYKYALSGMPFGRDPGLLWPQMKVIDGGATLGQTLGLFREAFFTKQKKFWGGPYAFDYKFKKNMQATLSRMLQHRSITYTAAECVELPPVTYLLEYVTLPREILQMYHGYVQEIIKARGNYRIVKNVFLRMRQLSSGFLGLKDDETGDRSEMDFDENPKLDRLMELIDELPMDAKALVFYDYTHSGRRISNLLREAKIKHIWLWSGTKDVRGSLAQFTDGDARIAVVNNQVGAYSLDGLQVANYEFHFESAVSVMDRSQAEKRIVRQGQTRKCFIYDLVAAGTVDAKILEFHREGLSLFDGLLANPQILASIDIDDRV